MKKTILFAITILFSIGRSVVSFADWDGSSTALVRLSILPSLTVGVAAAADINFTVDNRASSAVKKVSGENLQHSSGGLILADVPFAISVNADFVAVACGATDLQSDGGIGDTIPLHKHSGCMIVVENAQPLEREPAGYTGSETSGEGVFQKTDFRRFRANAYGNTNSVRLRVAWKPDEAQNEVKGYSGFVKLYAIAQPLSG